MRSDRILLSGSREERILQVFRLAGWYEGRCVDISEVEAHYQAEKVPMTDAAKAFFREYSGLAESWYLWGKREADPQKVEHSYDFYFWLYPDESSGPVSIMVYDEYPIRSEEQRRIDKIADEPTTLVGEAGYHFPAKIWIGESGTFYTWHFDYDQEIVRPFPSFLEFVKRDLRLFELNSASVSC